MASESNPIPSAPASNARPLAVPVQVQCETFRCLAYQNQAGQWLDYRSGEPLKGPVRVVEFQFPE